MTKNLSRIINKNDVLKVLSIFHGNDVVIYVYDLAFIITDKKKYYKISQHTESINQKVLWSRFITSFL